MTTVTLNEEALSRIVNGIKNDPEAVNKIAGAVKPPDPPQLNALAAQQIEELLSNEDFLKGVQQAFNDGKLEVPRRRRRKTKDQEESESRSESGEMGQDDDDDAQMGQRGGFGRTIEDLDRSVPFGIPAISMVTGGAVGLAMAETIDGLSPPATEGGDQNWAGIAFKILASWGSITFLPMWIGLPASTVASSIVLVSAARDVLPLDQWIEDFSNWVQGFFNGNGNGAAAWRGHQQIVYTPQPALGAGVASYPNGYQAGQLLPGHGGPGRDELANVFK